MYWRESNSGVHQSPYSLGIMYYKYQLVALSVKMQSLNGLFSVLTLNLKLYLKSHLNVLVSLYHYHLALQNIQICTIIILMQILTEKSLCLSLEWVCTYISPMPAYAYHAHRHHTWCDLQLVPTGCPPPWGCQSSSCI